VAGRKGLPLAEIVTPTVALVAWTEFRVPAGIPWSAEAAGGDAVAEFAGRSCYRAWDRPNPATATNPGYLAHLRQVGHLAAFEHASATFYLTGISRALAAELTRHRHFSFSELSPRQLAAPVAFVEPASVAADPALHAAFLAGVAAAEGAHRELVAGLQARHQDPAQAGLARKQDRQDARVLLPGAAETTLLVTGNFRAWRHLIGIGGADHADREMREVIIGCLRRLQELAPASFEDFVITGLPDGSALAASPLVADQ
jgi:thymidylate synthase (FAD)